jgi:hypothetical protein
MRHDAFVSYGLSRVLPANLSLGARPPTVVVDAADDVLLADDLAAVDVDLSSFFFTSGVANDRNFTWHFSQTIHT